MILKMRMNLSKVIFLNYRLGSTKLKFKTDKNKSWLKKRPRFHKSDQQLSEKKLQILIQYFRNQKGSKIILRCGHEKTERDILHNKRQKPAKKPQFARTFFKDKLSQ